MRDELINLHLRLFKDDWEFIRENFHPGTWTETVRELVRRAVKTYRMKKEEIADAGERQAAESIERGRS